MKMQILAFESSPCFLVIVSFVLCGFLEMINIDDICISPPKQI